MPYDEGLAERIRSVLADRPGVVEKKMFGGIAFMIRGHMSVGIVKDALMVRVGPEEHAKLLRRPHARPMDFTGRPMKGFLFVEPSGLESDADLERWIAHALDYATSLPAKGAPRRRRSAMALCLGFLLTPAVTRAADAPCRSSFSDKDAAAVRAVVEAYRTAWLRGDAKGVMATLTADAVLLPAHGAKPVIGTEAITKYWWPGGGPPTTITKLDITVEQVGGDGQVAHAHGRDDVAWTVEENGATKSYGHPGTYLNVFKRQPDGSWRISHHMWDDGKP